MAKASARHILVPSEADCNTLKKMIVVSACVTAVSVAMPGRVSASGILDWLKDCGTSGSNRWRSACSNRED